MTTQPPPGSIRIGAQRLDSVAEAQKRASFKILLPTYLPKNLRIVRIDYYVLPGKEQNPVGADWVKIFYEGDDRSALVIEQGNTGFPTGADAPADAHGVLSVQGRQAIWVNGNRATLSANPPQLGTWQRGVLSLGWEPNSGNNPDLPRGYSLTTLESFGLDELSRVAGSVQ
ncbi:MAG: hypothetical protein HYX51_11575 [Chloroflexi bacterium]|nr:hypothetical protein [Chloroflexota bacterium]